MKVKYNARANADKIAIAVYTVTEWGEEQWHRYKAQLTRACEHDIVSRIECAKTTPEFPGILRWRSGRHVVYFQRTDDGIEILRILHERMLPSKHL